MAIRIWCIETCFFLFLKVYKKKVIKLRKS